MMWNGFGVGNGRGFLLAMVWFIGLLLVLPGLSSAATLTVTTNVDPGTLGGCISAPATDCSLRDAVATAISDDTIDFSVTGTITLLSSIVIDKNLTIQGPVTISGGGTTQIFVIDVGITVYLGNLTLEDGYTADRGGAILNSGALTINESILDGNTAELSGGAIRSDGSLTITNSMLSNNIANDGGGGAVVNTGVATIQNVVASFNECQFISAAIAADGGAFYNAGSGTMSVIASTISSNTSVWGGGGIANSGTLVTVRDSTVSDNEANTNTSGHGGGGLFNISGAMQVINSTVSGNTALNNMGGGAENTQSDAWRWLWRWHLQRHRRHTGHWQQSSGW